MKKLSISMSHKEMVAGISYMVIQLLVLPSLLLWINQLWDFPLTSTQLNFAFFVIDFLAITVIFHRFLINSAKQALEKPLLCIRFAFFGLLLYWLTSYIVGLLIISIFPGYSNVNDQSIMDLTQQNYLLMAIGTVLLVPITEETLYRGIIFRGLYNRNPILGFAISTLAFSALHVIGYIGQYPPIHLVMCLIQYVPAGLCLAWAYYKADSIWAPILMHMTINQLGILSMR